MTTVSSETRTCCCCGALFTCVRWPDERGAIYCTRCRLLTQHEKRRARRSADVGYRDRQWEKRIKALIERPLPGHSDLILDDFLL